MGLRDLDAAILKELRVVCGCKGVLQREIMEWSSGEIAEHEGEKRYFLPGLRLYVSVRREK